ncbi:uncharacterized protein LOC123262288 [Cotesia glomerata]|uniref:uncharacterized protein LOC123262288 n=1 Tax=Cotesia glomerata TaxID=32391 RepID=UPI001D032E2D|nr:uncharacterized protein LOC123262288 [Cotesia glomerata]
MYSVQKNFEGYGTWYQMVVMVYGEKDIRVGIQILKDLARPVNPAEGLRLVSQLMDLFGPLSPEAVKAATFFCLQGIEFVSDPWGFEEVVSPNSGDLEILRVALVEAVFNGLIAMP